MSSKHRLVIADKEQLEIKTKEMLKNFFEISHFKGNTQELMSFLKDGDFLWIRLEHYLDQPFFSKCPNIRCILTNTTGLTHINEEMAAKRKIKIFNLNPEDKLLDQISSTSDHSIGLFYNLVRNINLATHDVSKGNWDRSKFKGRQIDSLTIGIVGFCRVGKKINSQLKCSVKRILFFDVEEVSFPNDQINLEKVSNLGNLLGRSDVIFICTKEQDNKGNVVNKDNINKIKKGAYLINTSRGSLMDFDACYEALLENNLSGLAIDVYEGEERGHMLHQSVLDSVYKHNLIITPHLAGNTKEAWELSEKVVADKLINFIN